MCFLYSVFLCIYFLPGFCFLSTFPLSVWEASYFSILPVDFYGEITGSQKIGRTLNPVFIFFLSCTGLLCGLVLAGPIIEELEELEHFLKSAASIIVSIPFRSRFCPFTTTEIESIRYSVQFVYIICLGCRVGCMVI